ncbi:MAG TPA: DUF1952 domain-containing protein [Anaerolineae bacterium]|nr:DUF1952 domain-containing protein [Anaerolineae bacterium]HMR63620.1 DUF1952 domain-containing protein [Anaerolineae bacterium]
MKLSFNAIPLWLMKEYLTELGATEINENVLTAGTWQAVVSKGEPFRLGSLQVGVTDVELSGDQAALEAMLEKLHWKTLRGGG